MRCLLIIGLMLSLRHFGLPVVVALIYLPWQSFPCP
nr:MAG TPA: hypothetical protein [Caudoviricetes sp.]